jgi:large subunit ribosomal protein L30
MAKLRITWKKSAIGYNKKQRAVVQALGLRRLNHTVEHYDTPSIRGMANKVIHLLHVEEVSEGEA